MSPPPSPQGPPAPAPSTGCSPSAQLHPRRSAWPALSLHSVSAQKSPCRSAPAGVPPARPHALHSNWMTGQGLGPGRGGLPREAALGPGGVRGRAGLQGLCPLPLPLSWSAQTQSSACSPSSNSPLSLCCPLCSGRMWEGRWRGCRVGSWPGQPQESRLGGAQVPGESRQQGLTARPPRGCGCLGSARGGAEPALEQGLWEVRVSRLRSPPASPLPASLVCIFLAEPQRGGCWGHRGPWSSRLKMDILFVTIKTSDFSSINF